MSDPALPDGGLPACAIELIRTVGAALDDAKAKWMVIGDAALALHGLAGWPGEGGKLTLIMDAELSFRADPSVRFGVFCTGGTIRWHFWSGPFFLSGSNPTWYRAKQGLDRAARLPPHNLSVAPSEYLLLDAIRDGVDSARLALEARGQVDWAFIHDVLAHEAEAR